MVLFFKSKVLTGSGAGKFTLWGGDLGVIGSNEQKSGGDPLRVPPLGDRKDGKKKVGRDLEGGIGRECPQGSGDQDTWYIHW